MNDGLSRLGWSAFFAAHLAPHAADGLSPARVMAQEKLLYIVHIGTAELEAELSGRFCHEAERTGGYPAVGDWVLVRPQESACPSRNLQSSIRNPESSADRAIVHALLPRRSGVSRKEPGAKTAEQVIAANIDTVFIVAGLDRDFNPRRLERYVATVLRSGATPVIVLNKADLHSNPAGAVAGLGTIAAGIAVHAVSAIGASDLAVLRPYLRPGETVAFIGSSGVGKSTIINRLLGVERQQTGEVSRAVGKGRHVTTRRELIPIPGGGLLMDTPGLRELQLWGDETELGAAFGDVAALAAQCRFRDCRHEAEPGCAVRAALESGDLDPERLRNYESMQRELRFLKKRQRWTKMKKHQPRPPDTHRGETE